MTRKELISVLAVISSVYQNQFEINDVGTVKVWLEVLKEFEFSQVQAAAMAYVTSGAKFPPRVGDITAIIQKSVGSTQRVTHNKYGYRIERTCLDPKGGSYETSQQVSALTKAELWIVKKRKLAQGLAYVEWPVGDVPGRLGYNFFPMDKVCEIGNEFFGGESLPRFVFRT